MNINEINHDIPLITNDATVLGILLAILGVIFYTSSLKGLKKFYTIVPALLLCYFLPSIVSSLGIIAPSGIDVEGVKGMLGGLNHDVSGITDIKSLKSFVTTNNIS
jgi:hypothetical protein